MSSPYYIGLMCGTSLDGIDAVLVEVISQNRIKLVKTHCSDLDSVLVRRIKSISVAGNFKNENSENNTKRDAIFELGTLHRDIGHAFAKAANQLLEKEPRYTLIVISYVLLHVHRSLRLPEFPNPQSVRSGVTASRSDITPTKESPALAFRSVIPTPSQWRPAWTSSQTSGLKIYLLVARGRHYCQHFTKL